MSLTLRYMRLTDISDVIAIDREAFSTPWSARSYVYEITQSHYSHMVTLEYSLQSTPKNWRRWLRMFNDNGSSGGLVVGYGGLWNIQDEAHISTVAVHSSWRSRGWGEVLLAGMVRRAYTLGASYVVLEVRVSNIVAQNLYKKYGFTIEGVKPEYYRDDGEHAYDMRLELNAEAHAHFAALFAKVVEQHRLIDAYTETPRPIIKE